METNIEFEEVKGKNPSLFGIISSPSIQFERMKEKAPVGLPLLIMMLLMAITGALVSYIGLSNPMLKDLNNTTGFKLPVGATIIFGAIGGLIGGTIMFFLSAAIYKLFLVLMGNDTPYMKVVSIVIYTTIITSLGTLLNAIVTLVLGGYETTYTSLVPLVGDNKTLKALAANFDIFQIWHYIVLAMGLHIAAGLNKNKAITLVVLFFLIGIGLSYCISLFQQTPGL